MSGRQAFQAKESVPAKKSSFSWLRPAAAHPAAETEHEAPSASSPAFAHDFTKVPVRPMQLPGVPGFSCPFAPQRCPSGGACHTCPPKMQAKLKIGQPGDRYEQEADRVAETVMRMPEPQVQRKGGSAPGCKDEDEDKLVQTKLAGSAGNAQVDHPLIQSVLSSPGQPLDAGTRSFMEPRFGQDFSGVRVHVGGQAAESARAVNARAYTVGREVVFGEGQYAPGSDEGKRLVAHELVHVLQQTDAVGEQRSRTGQRAAAVVARSQGIIQRADSASLGSPAEMPESGNANVYNCLKSLEQPMCDATWGPLENGGFRRWYFDFTGRKTPSNVEDAFGHCWVACAGTQRCGQTITFLTGRAREWYREYLDSDPHDSYSQDINNQALGREFGAAGANCDASCRKEAIVPPGRMDLSAPVMYLWSPRGGTEVGPDNPRFRGSYTSPTSSPHAVEPVNQNEIASTVNVFIQFLSSADREGYRRVMFTVSRTHTGRLITGIKKSNRQEKLLTNQGEHARTDMRALVQIAATNPVGKYLINALRENSGWCLSFDTV